MRRDEGWLLEMLLTAQALGEVARAVTPDELCESIRDQWALAKGVELIG